MPEKKSEKPLKERQEIGNTGMTREEAIKYFKRRFPERHRCPVHTPAVASTPLSHRPIRNGRPIGRNSECPCGSGKKYKRCCETGSPKK